MRITSDNAKRANALRLKTTGSALGSNSRACQLAEGQLLIVYNGDEDRTSGDAEVGSRSLSVLLTIFAVRGKK